MALEAVVFSQAGAGHFGYGRVDSPYTMPWCDLPGATGFGFAGDWGYDGLLASVAPDGADEWETASAKQDQSSEASAVGKGTAEPAAAAGRRKRRRAKVVKNKEEIETQRMTHIAVERNRRRQMNEHLAVLRSLMPPSYAHRGDQASIVGGAINYVRELEQLLQSLEVQKSIKNRDAGCSCTDAAGKSPFAGFFTFPQYSTSSSHAGCAAAATSSNNTSNVANGEAAGSGASGDRAPAVADIEVTMVEGHASLKVLVPQRPKQLLKLVAGLQHLRVPPLHLNVTSVDAMVLYTFSLKVEDDSKMGSVEDIATAVHEILSRIRRQEVEEETAVM